MPTPIIKTSDGLYPIRIEKGNLEVSHQFDDACSMISGRMIQHFGLSYFLMRVLKSMRYTITIVGDLDGRKSETKRLQAAEDALAAAAHEYDEAVKACRESLTKKSRRT